ELIEDRPTRDESVAGLRELIAAKIARLEARLPAFGGARGAGVADGGEGGRVRRQPGRGPAASRGGEPAAVGDPGDRSGPGAAAGAAGRGAGADAAGRGPRSGPRVGSGAGGRDRPRGLPKRYEIGGGGGGRTGRSNVSRNSNYGRISGLVHPDFVPP